MTSWNGTRVIPASHQRLVISHQCVDGIRASITITRKKSHEGVVYLLGKSDASSTVAVSAMLPTATTTAGSFNVSAIAMATVVRSAANLGLAVVGQVHTHPRQAFHSEGDFDGMRIRYPGYVSIVLPNYGRLFPKWTGAEILMCAGPHDYFEIDSASLVEVNGDCS